MKILITGANGMLAKEVIEKFRDGNELILTDVAELDITNKENVDNFISEKKPEVIINCAAFTAVDKAETAGEIVEKRMMKRNQIQLMELQNYMEKRTLKIIQINITYSEQHGFMESEDTIL